MESTVTSAAVLALATALDEGLPPPDDTPAALAWAALDAAGIGGGFREAVVAAGGPLAVLSQGAVTAFSSPRRRRHLLEPAVVAARLRLLLPWLGIGCRIVADDVGLRRFTEHPACAFYAFGAPLPDPTRAVVGIVGSREAGPDLLARTAALARRCAEAGVVVVSGGAIGVDSAARQAARGAGGDVVVISGHALTGRIGVPGEVIADAGLTWLTPYAPWSPGRPKGRFAQRNAFIAAMADVVVAVAGGPKSGTRHTVEAALLFGRPVVALSPCPTQPDLAALATRLVDSGAGVIVADDVTPAQLVSLRPPAGAHAAWLQTGQLVLDLAAQPAAAPMQPAVGTADVDMSHPLLQVLRARGALSIDDAAAVLAVGVRDLLVDVATLELDGALRREGAVLSLTTPLSSS